ncbi:MAG: S9 family peptidase [Candidatus Krumholzibacteria bacterium]|nr:S9 family peptidase [Candidatus Krumholzibacteria bacterium]
MEPISFKARDGLAIQGYITYPTARTRRDLPLVIRVHGGPWARDYWGYNPEVQWLASRGYACLQVNSRGSSGYGKDFVNAGNREWGGRMQKDLIDAVDWAVGQGIADSERVAIFGSSYGGYAALEGMATDPGLFCCGIDVSGQSDLLGWLGSLPRKYGPIRSTIFMRVGNPETDAEFLQSRSPLYKADRIRDPLLVIQGERDPFVPRADTERIIAALNANGIECVYLLFPDEGQGISRLQDRMIFWNAAEKFLAEHLGGRSDESSARWPMSHTTERWLGRAVFLA